MNIEELLKELQAQGLAPEQILEQLKQMLAEGKIAQEDLDKAMELLQGAEGATQPTEDEEKARASELLGVQL